MVISVLNILLVKNIPTPFIDGMVSDGFSRQAYELAIEKGHSYLAISCMDTHDKQQHKYECAI